MRPTTAIILLALALPAAAQPSGITGLRCEITCSTTLFELAQSVGITGPASVTDGDTIRVLGRTIRLRGVAAPERDDADGPAATAFLRQLVEGQDVSCLPDGTKTRGRIVAVCFRDGQDIGQLIIQAGHARDCPRFSGGGYAAAEARARAAGRDLSRIYALPSYCLPR